MGGIEMWCLQSMYSNYTEKPHLSTKPKLGKCRALTYLSLPGDAQLVVDWCQQLSSILFRGVSNLRR
jgi:hypothetical protein